MWGLIWLSAARACVCWHDMKFAWRWRSLAWRGHSVPPKGKQLCVNISTGQHWVITDDSLDWWQHGLYFLLCSNQVLLIYSQSQTNYSPPTLSPSSLVLLLCVFFLCVLSLHVPWTWAICTFWERLRALWQLFLLALEFRGLRGPQSITALSSPPSLSSLPGLPSLPRPHYSSLAPRKLLWQLIISWHKAERQRL